MYIVRPTVVHHKSEMSAGMCRILYPSPIEIWAEDGSNDLWVNCARLHRITSRGP